MLFFIVLPSAFGIDEYAFYGIIPMILIPLTFAYAIVRFQMLNVRVIVRRTFLYAATTAVLLGLYALVVALANLVFASSRLSASPLFNFGFFLVGISLFEVMRRRLQAPLDKLFFREKFDYQAALLEMSEAITGELDLGRIADYLTSSVVATMRLEKASIWLRDRDGWLERRGPPRGAAVARPRRSGGCCARRGSPRTCARSRCTSPTTRASIFASGCSRRGSSCSCRSSTASGSWASSR